MLKGKLIALLTIFSSVSLIGTGFSSWVIGTSNLAVTGNITVAEVADIKSIIDFDKSGDHPNGYTCFSYCSEGFVENSAFVSTGTLTYYFKININKAIAQGYLSNTNHTTFETILSLNGNSNQNFYTTLKTTSLTLVGSSKGSPVITNYDDNNDGINESIKTSIIITSFNSSSSAETLPMSVSYIFDSTLFDLGVNFDTDNPPSFNFKLNMTKE